MKNKSIQKIFSFTLSIIMMLALIPTITSFAWATEEPPAIELSGVSTITEETIVFNQNFDDLTALPDDWNPHTGTWSVSNGKLHQSQDMAIGDGPALITFGEDLDHLENFRFEATIQFKNAPLYWSIMGISFDVQSSYPLTFAGFYRDTSEVTGVQFGKYNGGPYLSLEQFGTAPNTLSDGETHHIKIEVFGTYGDIYFDNILVLPNAEITRRDQGSFGLIMCYGGIGYYDAITITALPYRLPSIITEKLQDATVGLPYVQQLVSEGDKITWNKYNGALPDGLTLLNNGIISGTPLTSGVFTFTVKAENTKGEDLADFSITVNADYTSSFEGRGVDFSSGDIQLVSTSKLLGSPKTFEAWVKLSVNSQGIGVIAGNGATDGFGLAVINFGVTADGNPWLYWKEMNGNIANYTAYVNVKLGDWVHVAIVQDNQNHKLVCYVNGVKADEQTFSILEDTIPVRPLKIGGDYLWNNDRCFSGEIADIRIWSTVRTPIEIQANMNKQLNGDETGLMANWLLNDDDGVVSYKDNSVYGNDLRVWHEWLEPEFADGDYTIAVIPDIQYMTLYYQDVLNALFDWVYDNTEARNIQFMIQVGDLTDANTVAEWQLVQDNLAKLDDVVPYVFIPGNHDYNGMPVDRDTTLFNDYLSYNKYSQTPIFGGAYEDGKLDNAYYYFTVDDTSYLILCLEMAPRGSVIDWSNDVVASNSNCRVIVVTHSYLSYNGAYDGSSGYDPTGNGGQSIWDQLVSQHANIIMVLCGHIHYDDLVIRINTGIYGNAIPQLLVDAQDMDYYHEGVGMIALLTFSNNGRNVAVNWYSVKEGKLFRDWNQFTFSVELGTHTITFDTQGGSEISKQTIEHGNLLSEPTAPTRSGYTFTGWFYGENLFNFNTRITTDITLTANWTKNDDVTVWSIDELKETLNDPNVLGVIIPFDVTLELACSVTVDFGVTLTIQGTLNLNKAGIINNAGTINNVGGTICNAGGIINNYADGIVSNSAYGVINISDAGVINNYQAIINNNAATINNDDGTINNNDRGIVNNYAEGVLNNYNSGVIYSSGIINNNVATINNIDAAVFTNEDGMINNNAATINNNNGGTINNNGIGMVNNYADGEIYNSGAGVINNNEQAILNNAATITNAEDSVINNAVGASINNGGGTISNGADATINNNGGVINNYGAGTINNNAEGVICNSGVTSVINNYQATINNNNASTINNDAGGMINNNDATIDSNGGIINNDGMGMVNNYDAGVILNYNAGVINNYLATINNGATIDNRGGGTINNDANGAVYTNELGVIYNDEP
ncbi:MAG: InlB B-repeat-containing protein [Nitrososphaerota archaeon]|jgi:uncharacterized repeat protein (TIGR02543 family)|nr:InlB B-repeat-containing protein [Nitrososphaerota archaeon]